MDTRKLAPRFSSQPRVVLPGSEKAPLAADPTGKLLRPGTTMTVSVMVRPKTPLNTRRLGKERLTRTQFRQQHGADPAAVKLVRAFAREFGLAVDQDASALAQRILKLKGTVAAMQKAFAVDLSQQAMGRRHLPRAPGQYFSSPRTGRRRRGCCGAG